MTVSSDWWPGMKVASSDTPDDVRTIDRRKDDDSGWWLTDRSGLADGVATWEQWLPHLQGDGPCDDCGGPNIVWFTDDVLWNRVVRDHDAECILCVHCFVARAENFYAVKGWKLAIAPEMNEHRCGNCGDVITRDDPHACPRKATP